jgi:transposase
MSTRELGRVEVLARIRSKQLRIVEASQLMGVSYRQAKRLWKRYREEGAAGLKHRSAGRRSNHAREWKLRKKVLQLVREKYGGAVGERFGPTLAAEHLACEDGLKIDAETLRRWMLAEGLWSRERRRKRHRRRRERKEHFGEMMQMRRTRRGRNWESSDECPWIGDSTLRPNGSDQLRHSSARRFRFRSQRRKRLHHYSRAFCKTLPKGGIAQTAEC